MTWHEGLAEWIQSTGHKWTAPSGPSRSKDGWLKGVGIPNYMRFITAHWKGWCDREKDWGEGWRFSGRIDARLQFFIQLSPTVTKLCHIKCDHPACISANDGHFEHWMVALNHRLNGSSSPVLTATCLSYGSLCDFLTFSPTDLEVTPLDRFWRKMAQTTWIHEHMCLLG